MRRLAALSLCLLGLALAGWLLTRASPPAEPAPAPAAASAAVVQQFCGTACHAYPPPDTFPRALWRHEVKQAYELFHQSDLRGDYPSLESVARYYEEHAPVALPLPEQTAAPTPAPVRFTKTGYRFPAPAAAPAVSHVQVVRLSDPRRAEVLVCDARRGQVLSLRPWAAAAPWRVLGAVPHPAHAEVVDLDGDGIRDLLVADLGSFGPTDDRVGQVVWLRGTADGTFTAVPLLQGVGRVADVQAADINGDGKLDLVVAVFGWRRTGEILYLENRTEDWSRPVFVPHVVDARHGAIHVPIADLDGDGRPDFVALFSQEHETVVAFLNTGGGAFRPEVVYRAPHPAYGSSGIQLIDLNGDGRLDVLYTNGDVLDPPPLLKPYHGVQWLENRGRFPFTHHPLLALPGAHRAVAADVDGDGDLDIVAVSFLPPPEQFPQRKEVTLDSVVLLEQTAPGRFARHALEQNACDHVSCAAGDLYGDGRVHLVTGNFSLSPAYTMPESLTLWQNLGGVPPARRDP